MLPVSNALMCEGEVFAFSGNIALLLKLLDCVLRLVGTDCDGVVCIGVRTFPCIKYAVGPVELVFKTVT